MLDIAQREREKNVHYSFFHMDRFSPFVSHESEHFQMNSFSKTFLISVYFNSGLK